MTSNDDVDQLRASASAPGPVASVVERLAERLGAFARASTVFGEPVERDGVTVIPVAKVSWGLGGGGGEGKGGQDGAANSGTGGGGGGGGRATPAGYIEITSEGARYVRFRDPAALAGPIIAAGFAGWLLLRGLRGLFRK